MGNEPSVVVTMLIRKPINEVYHSMIDPEVTTNFWFTKSSGPLKEGKSCTWTWEMYGVSADVQVKKLTPNQLISFDWGDPPTSVDFKFDEINSEMTFVTVHHYGFELPSEQLLAAIADSTGGFTMVLAGMKAYLEHGIKLNLVGDKYPKEVADKMKKQDGTE